jgi:hypothetical protein
VCSSDLKALVGGTTPVSAIKDKQGEVNKEFENLNKEVGQKLPPMDPEKEVKENQRIKKELDKEKQQPDQQQPAGQQPKQQVKKSPKKNGKPKNLLEGSPSGGNGPISVPKKNSSQKGSKQLSGAGGGPRPDGKPSGKQRK